MATKIKKKTLLTPTIRKTMSLKENHLMKKVAEVLRAFPEPTTKISDIPADDNSLRDAEVASLKADIQKLNSLVFSLINEFVKLAYVINPQEQSGRDALIIIKTNLESLHK